MVPELGHCSSLSCCIGGKRARARPSASSINRRRIGPPEGPAPRPAAPPRNKASASGPGRARQLGQPAAAIGAIGVELLGLPRRVEHPEIGRRIRAASRHPLPAHRIGRRIPVGQTVGKPVQPHPPMRSSDAWSDSWPPSSAPGCASARSHTSRASRHRQRARPSCRAASARPPDCHPARGNLSQPGFQLVAAQCAGNGAADDRQTRARPVPSGRSRPPPRPRPRAPHARHARPRGCRSRHRSGSPTGPRSPASPGKIAVLADSASTGPARNASSRSRAAASPTA